MGQCCFVAVQKGHSVVLRGCVYGGKIVHFLAMFETRKELSVHMHGNVVWQDVDEGRASLQAWYAVLS